MTTKYQISEPSGQAIYSIKNVKQLLKIHGTVATLRQRVNGEWDTAQRKTILLGASVSLEKPPADVSCSEPLHGPTPQDPLSVGVSVKHTVE